MDDAHTYFALGSALAGGLMIGIERGWRLRGEPDGGRVAGVRTFTLLGLVGGVAGLVGVSGFPLVSGLIAAAAGTVIAAGYARALLKGGGPDATSGIAAIATLGLGFVGGMGQPAIAVAAAAVVTLILALRAELHRWVGRLDEADIKAFARYAVIAGAIYPFLPDGRFGPYDALDPHTLWAVVIIVTGFSFAGYAANRVFGARRGTIATAIIGGAYSSTAVTQSLAQRLGSRTAAGDAGAGAENAGIAIASAVMYLRVTVLVAIIAGSLLRPFVVAVAPALLTAWIASLLLYRRSAAGGEPETPGNPIALIPALGFVVFVALAAIAARWAEIRFGEQGIAVLLLLMGSMDVDAAIVTAGGLEPGAITPALAALAIGGTILANMAVKLGITLVYGRRRAAPAATALAASMVALAASLAVGWLRL